jgi:hypothetical protein
MRESAQRKGRLGSKAIAGQAGRQAGRQEDGQTYGTNRTCRHKDK